MASRRTRIKGIANIPQRRKTLNTPQNPEDVPPTTPEATSQEPNLNVEHDQVGEVGPNFETKIETPPVLNDAVIPIRRKFIKPTVSLNAINRKPKDTEEVKEDKIIVLSEVIAHPGQNQPVVIQDYVNNSTKSPEIEEVPQLTLPELEYPIPPPSPSKINRSRIKAVPRLGHRNTSYSASESEDETRRNYRHRNDSVCSSASGFLDSNSIPECPSPQKPKEFSSVIQRKCRRTEQSRKLAEARRDFYMKFGHKKPDRQKLTMIDLIFYNPVTNPMSDNKGKRKISEVSEETEEQEEKEEKVDDPRSDEENEMPAPQIKIGPQGELIVDEQSLVIENKELKKNREELEKSQVVNGDFETGYGVYKRAKRSKDWTKQETLKFYKALNTIGTDFTLMCELFPRRSRRELKMKFKKEERINKNLIDRAIMQPCGFDFTEFKHEVDMEEKELEELEKQKERERLIRKEVKKKKLELKKEEKTFEPPKKKKRTFDIMNVLDDSDADESEIEDEEKVLESLQKPTRSGRVPKILERYKAPESPKFDKAKPGSLIVVASTGPNGQPVYKVCMVTGEHGRKQIGEDMTSLQKALECKENGIQDLFTLSAELAEFNETIPAEENNETIPAEENNETIPAEEDNETTPAEENNETIPAEENNETIPAEESNETNPAEEDNETIPAEKDNDINPAEEDNDINPAEEDNETTPAEENNETIPAEEDNETIPAEEDNETIPAEESNETNPAEKDNEINPAEEDNDINPAEEDNETTPAEENNETIPAEEDRDYSN